MIIRWLAVAVMGTLLAVAGCGKTEETSTSATPGKIHIVYIPKNSGNPYFDKLAEGFKTAAKEMDADFSMVAPATADATSQVSIIDDQIQLGANVIAISPNSIDALNPTLKKAMDKGIIVVTVDSDLTGNEQFRNVGVFTVDPEVVGKSQIELMGSQMGYSGKFAILSATTDAPNQNVWIEFMKATLKNDPKYKDMQLVDVVYGNDDPQKSRTEAETLMTKYPDLKGILAPTTVGIAAAAQAVETVNKAAQIHVTGLGTPNQMRRFIKDGTVQAFALWMTADEGYLSCEAGVQLAKKTFIAAPGAKFTAGTLGEREVKDKNIIITSPPTTFNKDNIDKYDF